ncbi:sulfotransferase family cytosolic 1B member 1-like protein [Dinothrombium tinctorium]|uniref:Sulfotransferase family cytosolic 1B member 1-like protein n=1 Tax=Dinothrombium tinctorium TaxID=1965070 RepID=A0A443QIY5_9ACAR|nr:sulfotransferase family cytosolic 1B member 1-like protein [Dinothrombium tinctorium]
MLSLLLSLSKFFISQVKIFEKKFVHLYKKIRTFSQVIYIVRNPKDQCVSYYHFHQTAKYLGGVKWNWNTFLELYRKGYLVYGSWKDHVNGWWRVAEKRPDKVLFISYEQLHWEFENTVKRIAQFTDKPISDDFIRKLANHCSFDRMRSNNAVNRVNIPLRNFFDQSQVKFMRKGKIGDWKNMFTESQEREFDDFYGSLLNEIGLSDKNVINEIESSNEVV